METSPQKKKKKKNDTANHLKQSKSYAYSDPDLFALRVHRCCSQTTTESITYLTSLNKTEVWINLRYEQGRRNAIPDYENNQNGQI